MPAIPPELDALVLSLLSHDPSARPRSASEVIDRLTAIAGSHRTSSSRCRTRTSSTPELVGRAPQLAAVRARIAELLAGRGGALVLEGAPGMGRSRMLDTVVLEAKLSGLIVARGSASDTGGYGVVGRLLRQLAERLPEADLDRAARAREPRAARRWRGHARRRRATSPRAPGGADRGAARGRARPADPDRDRRLRPLRRAVAGRARVGAARLPARARADRADLRTRKARRTARSRCCASSARVVELTPFALEDTEALLSSLFSDVPHVHALAARIHARADGSPRGCMELTEHLKARGLVRYSAGSWELPAELDDDDLPSSLSSARKMRLQALSADARELAEALAVADGSGLDFHAYVELIEHGDLERVRMALDELLLAQVLRCEGVSYSFEAQAYAIELRDVLSEERSRTVCARIAHALERRGSDRLEIARYAFRAADERRTSRAAAGGARGRFALGSVPHRLRGDPAMGRRRMHGPTAQPPRSARAADKS